jgi:hypothetical protein
MSFYDDASLVVIPSGYKTSKVYAEKPTDGSGDLAFTRTGDTATRVNSAGLIEKVRTNLVLQSEAFSNNTAWPKLNSATVTANTSVAPDGTTTADTLTLTTNTSSSIYQAITTISGLTFSVYAKVASGTKNFRLRFDRPSPIESADFTATTTWQRFTFTATTTGSGNVYIINDSTGTAGDLIIWGAQLETGDIATDYIPTTTAAVSVGPVSGLPRLDYLGSTCGKLLLEPQRSNLLLNSENYSGSNWVLGNSTVTVNQAASPDGYTNADLFKEDSTNNFHRLFDSGKTISTTTTYTSSIFVKNASGTRNFRISFGGGFGEQYVTFNINNGTIVSQDNATGVITPYGNGWYRCSATATSGAVSNVNVIYWLTSGNVETYQGNGTSGVYLYGSQAEVGAYATSYVPTLAASATRGADAASKTGISSLIGQTEGTIFVDVNLPNNAANDIFTFASAGVNDIFLASNGGNLLTRIYSNSTALFFAQYAITAAGGRFKMAISYKSGDSAFYVNGTLVGTNAGSIAFSAALSDINLTNNQYAGLNSKNINQALLFKTRLTNAEMAEITTL